MDKDKQAFLLEGIGQEIADLDKSRDLASSISWLLDLHLSELDEWKYCWIDGLLETTLKRRNGSIELLAHVVLYKGDGNCWMDPLQAFFSVNRSGRITRYELRFGDQDRPSEPYKLHRKHEPSRRHRWSYCFKKDDT